MTHQFTGAMQDGRFGRLYASTCALNDGIRASQNIRSWDSNAYREYMVAHGLKEERVRMQSAPCGPMACADMGAAVADPAPAAADALAGVSPSPYERAPSGA